MAAFTRGLVSIKRQFGIAALALCAWCVPATAEFDYQALLDKYPIGNNSDPELGRGEPSEQLFVPGLKELWLQALDRPDAELRRMVIDTLASAHRRGVDDLVDTRTKLIEILNEPDQDLEVIRAIAATLVAFESKQDAALLGKLAIEHGSLLAATVEPAIARWGSPVLLDEWTHRISSQVDNQTATLLAIDGLAQLGADTIKTAGATAPLQTIALDSRRSIAVRIAAARAIGTLDDDGLLQVAEKIAARTSSPVEVAPILAIELLGSLEDDASIDFLVGLLGHDRTIVQAKTLGRLYEIDSLLVAENAPELLDSPDANVRRWCAKGLIENCTPPRVAMICRLLNDTNPTIRTTVATELVRLHQDTPELANEIIASTMNVLGQDSWRGCEQACVVLTTVDFKEAGERMVELLSHPRGEVQIAAGWGLSRLKIPELLPAMHDHAKRIVQLFQSGKLNSEVPGAEMHMAHLFYTFGALEFDEVEPLLRKYIPKNPLMGNNARGAAVWALGIFHEGKPDDELEKLLMARMNDDSYTEPEAFEVQQMSAIALGRMNAKQALPSLRKIASHYDDPFSRAGWWAINRITGEETPAFRISPPRIINDWFLAPVTPKQ